MDYSVHEHCIDMTSSRHFWHDQLQGCDLERRLALPFDRHRSSAADQRSGLASSHTITFDGDMCASFLHYASSHHLTLFQLALATYYAFLFRLTHGQSDLCLASINANRYRHELMNMIGMFVSTLPYRAQVDGHWSFDDLVQHVQEKCLSVLEHAHYPLQEILADFRLNQSQVVFLETMLDFITLSEDAADHWPVNGNNLEQVSVEESDATTKFDFSLTFLYNPLLDGNQLSCCFMCSQDLFDETTIAHVAQRFQSFLHQLFASVDDQNSRPIYELSLTLSNERLLSQSLNNTQVSFPSSAKCIHHEFVCQVMAHPQKLAVELDDQSLTYAELLYYVQMLSLHLLSDYHISVGEVICQCVERSLSMVS